MFFPHGHGSGGRFLIPSPAIQFVWVGRPTPCLPMAASPPSSPSPMDPKARLHVFSGSLAEQRLQPRPLSHHRLPLHWNYGG
ncbi:unnamed protein product [Sphagnum jensenii]|uniref:Uncharacterized protein n=1 Tax=Sphagnum jensenii TaxID=128206 RepID=A0ABP0WCE5_9BRYO